MEKIAYIVDSACFLSEQEVKELGMYFIPFHVIIEGEDYLEGKSLSKEVLIDAISKKKSVTTSQPSPGEVMQLIKQVKADGYTSAVVSMIGSGLSKTLENIINTGEMEDFKIYPIDAGSVGLAQLQPILKAKKLIESGQSVDDALLAVQEDVNTSLTLLLVDDLFHLSRGGRITPTVAALGSMLKIKPILSLIVEKGGEIDIIEKVRTTKRALKDMVKKAVDGVDTSTHEIIVAHFDAYERAQEVKQEIESVFPELDIEIKELTTVIGVHTGLESVGIQVCKKI